MAVSIAPSFPVTPYQTSEEAKARLFDSKSSSVKNLFGFTARPIRNIDADQADRDKYIRFRELFLQKYEREGILTRSQLDSIKLTVKFGRKCAYFTHPTTSEEVRFDLLSLVNTELNTSFKELYAVYIRRQTGKAYVRCEEHNKGN